MNANKDSAINSDPVTGDNELAADQPPLEHGTTNGAEHHAPHAGPQHGNPDKEKKHWLEYATAGFALIAALGSIAAVVTTLLQWSSMRDQLVIMTNEQRAWLSMKLEIAGSLYWEQAGPAVPIIFTMRNIGHLPAKDIRLRVSAIIPYPTAEDPVARQQDACLMHGAILDIGNVMFPGDDLSETGIVRGPQEVNMLRQANQMSGHPLPKEIGSVILYIVGCAIYRSGDDPIPHHTGFIDQLGVPLDPNDESVIGAVKPFSGETPANALRLRPYQKSAPVD